MIERQQPDIETTTATPAPAAAPQKRYNTTPSWGDPYRAPNPSDPYYAEWAAANPGIPESAAPAVGTQLNANNNTPYNPKPAETPTTTPGPTTNPGGSTDTGLGSLFTPFGQTYTAPAPVNLGGPAGIPYIPPVPSLNITPFEKPPAFQYKDFELPTLDDVNADPGMELRRSLGQRGIESSAAAQGRSRTGGTLNDIMKYNQAFASTDYGNVLDRKLGQYQTNRANAVDTYNTNYKTQYSDPFSFNEEAAKAAFAPIFSQWQVQGQAGQRQNELNNDQAWSQFLQNYRSFDDQRKFTYGALSDQERIGVDAATR